MNKALLTSAFEKLGPERVANMKRAWGPEGGSTYACCALAFAWGEPGELRRLAHARAMPTPCYAPRALGLTCEETRAIDSAHTRWINNERAEALSLVPLIEEWLEHRPVEGVGEPPALLLAAGSATVAE